MLAAATAVAALVAVRLAAASGHAGWLAGGAVALLVGVGLTALWVRTRERERVELVDRLRTEADRVRALLRVSQDIAHAAPLAETVVTICRHARALLRADHAMVIAWDEEAARFTTVFDDTMSPEEAARGLPFEPAPDARRTYARVEEGRLIVAPLTHAGRPYGVLMAQRIGNPERFDPGDMALLEGMARQCAMALDNLRLFEEERTAASLALTLLEVTREFNLAFDQPGLFSRLAARGVELTGAEAAVVAVREPRRTTYRIEWLQGLAPEQAERLHGMEIEGPDVGRHLARAVGATQDGASHLSVPMERGGEDVGVLLLAWPPGHAATRRQGALALGLATQAAVALQTVRLVADSREASRIKSEFVATMSHELRTPLNVVMGYTDLLVEEAFGTLNEEQRSVLGRMQRSARELLDLITATLDLNRLEAGKSRLAVEEVEVAALLAQLEAETAARLDRRGLDIRWEVAGDVPRLETDLGKLRMVLKNLVGNAIKFTEQGSVSITARPDGDGVVFTVADTGIGIRSEDLPVIFDMFRQVECANTRRHGGVGLGLYIVKRLLGELRGEIEVASEPGAGSEFRVRVPARLPAPPPPAAAA